MCYNLFTLNKHHACQIISACVTVKTRSWLDNCTFGNSQWQNITIISGKLHLTLSVLNKWLLPCGLVELFLMKDHKVNKRNTPYYSYTKVNHHKINLTSTGTGGWSWSGYCFEYSLLRTILLKVSSKLCVVIAVADY